MLRKLIFAGALLCAALLPSFANAQQAVAIASCGSPPNTLDVNAPHVLYMDNTGKLCVAASVSASISGFQPGANGTPISVTTSSTTGTLPAGAVVVASNVGANGAFCSLGATATASGQYIPPGGGWFAFTVGAATQLSCITASSTTTINMVGGSGLPTGTGGGGGSGGGGGAITAASGSYASGAFSAGAGTDGWDATQGAKTDAACGTATGTCSVVALLKYNNSTAPVLGAGTAIIGKAGIDQTTPGTTNGIVNLAAAVGGSSTTGNIAANNTTAVVVKASAGTLYGVQVYGIGSAPAYLKIYNATSATCGSGTPVKRLMIPAASTAANGAGSNISFGPAGVAFGTGITYCVTTGITDADTTAPAASTFLVNLDWQ